MPCREICAAEKYSSPIDIFSPQEMDARSVQHRLSGHAEANRPRFSNDQLFGTENFNATHEVFIFSTKQFEPWVMPQRVVSDEDNMRTINVRLMVKKKKKIHFSEGRGVPAHGLSPHREADTVPF